MTKNYVYLKLDKLYFQKENKSERKCKNKLKIYNKYILGFSF